MKGDLVMDDNSSTKIRRRIKRAKQGHFFILNDFLDIADRDLAKVQLNQFVNEGVLKRSYHGVYQKPKVNKKFNLDVPPTVHEIISQIARKNNQQVVPAGDTALNFLGLSTQVPVTYEYLTDGPSRKIKISETQTVKLKHSGTKTFVKGDIDTAMIIGALNLSPAEEFDEKQFEILAKQLGQKRYQRLSKAAKKSTQKTRHLVDRIGDYVIDRS